MGSATTVGSYYLVHHEITSMYANACVMECDSIEDLCSWCVVVEVYDWELWRMLMKNLGLLSPRSLEALGVLSRSALRVIRETLEDYLIDRASGRARS